MRTTSLIKAGFCAGLAASLLLAGLVLRPSDACATPPEANDWVAPVPTATAPVGLDAGVQQDSDTATIVFITVPNVTAVVTWGRKILGKITPGKPLVVMRPRDSGPLDVMVRAPGYLAVQTRAHTFSDTRILVKLTTPDKKSELVGYRVPIEAGADGGEGGAPLLQGDAGAAWDGMVAPVLPAAAPVSVPSVPAPTP